MKHTTVPSSRLKLRDPREVMRLERLGASHATRLSFMRVLLRRLYDENWRFDVADWQIDSNGVGHAVLAAHGPERSYSLVAFAHDLPAEKRSDRAGGPCRSDNSARRSCRRRDRQPPRFSFWEGGMVCMLE